MKIEPATTPEKNCCDGKVVKITGNQLVAAGEQGEQNHYTVAKDTRVTCDGKESKLSELKKGATIRMTLCEDDETKVIAVDCEKHISVLESD